MNDHAQQYAKAIADAKSGVIRAENFLRLRLARNADSMPADLLIALSETILEYRRGELRDEASRN